MVWLGFGLGWFGACCATRGTANPAMEAHTANPATHFPAIYFPPLNLMNSESEFQEREFSPAAANSV